MDNSEMRFSVGTKYRPRGKDYECTVTDFLITRRLDGRCFKSCYVASHMFCGQAVFEYDVCETTIARGNPQPSQAIETIAPM